MKKGLIFLTVLIVASVGLFAQVNVLSPVGPTLVSLVGILEDKVQTESEINVEYWSSFDQITAQLVTGKADLVIVPVALGEMLYDKGLDVQLAAVTLWKSFYLVTAPELDVKGLEDLRNVEIYTPQGTGQTGDILMRYEFARLGIDDFTIKYATPPEIIGLMATGKVQAAVLPEPFVTLATKKVKGAKIALDMQEIWGDATGIYRVPITGVMVRTQALQERPLEIVSALNALSNSIDYAMSHQDEAVQLTAKYFSGMPAPVMKESLGRSEYGYDTVLTAKDEVQRFLETVNTIDKAIPVPDEGFYAQ
ncbi:MAG TPA: ABC transporter substrate-binding protein [Thermotogota bacterium]|nr:ABC transporter substrate-binding protein [Thermotogota bacterium]HPJ89633.1 ABC transporter substrate-binding protein [Thermotogota bacterium]HPR96816.1 ABC transporter substrate-binding protein [Thermotogota bacterium]